MESIHPFVFRKVLILKWDTPARDAAKAMRDNRVGCVLVTDSDGRLAGIVTDRDFATRLTADFTQTDIPLAEFMTSNVVTATTDVRVSDILDLMETNGIRRVPLVESGAGASSRCIGLVTLDDLATAKLVDSNRLARVVQRQLGRRILKTDAHPHTARADRRSGARSEQVLERFYHRIADHTGLSRDVIPGITTNLLGMLAMRLTSSGAVNFAAQLPKAIQDYVLGLPPGPDREITAEKMRASLVALNRFSEGESANVLRSFLGALAAILDPGEVAHIRAQLPRDIGDLLAMPPPQKKAA